MKRTLIIMCLSILAATTNAQEIDYLPHKIMPVHCFSISPVRVVFLDQAGLTYEYHDEYLGIGLSTGYKYASGRNYTRFFIATSNNNGPYEFYTGFYLMPQINLYFNKPKLKKTNLLVYINFKGNYKYLHVDSLEFHVWDNRRSENNFYYRRQIDKVKIFGITGGPGLKLNINHFFIDFNFGVGYIYHHHNMLVAGEALQAGEILRDPSAYPFPDTLTYSFPTLNFCLSFGLCF
jgi:hypothetical protein